MQVVKQADFHSVAARPRRFDPDMQYINFGHGGGWRAITLFGDAVGSIPIMTTQYADVYKRLK